MLLKEAEEILKKNGYTIDEAEEPGYMRGELSAWDRRRIEQGRAPSWAKKVTDIGPRKKELRQSSSYSEIAMRSVNTPDGKVKKPYTETDWRRDKENAKAMNARIAEELQKLLTNCDHVDTENFADYFSVYVKADDGQLDEFRIMSRGTGYFVKFVGHKSIFDRDGQRCASLKDVADYINNKG